MPVLAYTMMPSPPLRPISPKTRKPPQLPRVACLDAGELVRRSEDADRIKIQDDAATSRHAQPHPGDEPRIEGVERGAREHADGHPFQACRKVKRLGCRRRADGEQGEQRKNHSHGGY